MENCKFCNQELEEGSTLCPHCGKDNAEPETIEETPVVEETPVEETSAQETSVEEAPTQEVSGEETPAEAPKKKATPGKIALAVGAIVVLVAILVALIVAGVKSKNPTEAPADTIATEETVPMTVPADGNPDDVTAKGTYTVTDEEALAAKDTVVATIGEHQLTNGELQVHYWSTVSGFMTSQQGYYLTMGGALDFTKPLDMQKCLLNEEQTWQQMFLQQALNNWQTSVSLAAEAEKAGIPMNEEARKFVDGIDQYLAETAEGIGMTPEQLLKANVGPGADARDFAAYHELYNRGSGYFAQETAKFVPTQEELKAFYDKHAEEYAAGGLDENATMVDVRHILVTAKAQEGATDITEEEWKAAETEAQFILDTWLAGAKTEESFAALANEKSEDPGSNTNGGLYENVVKGRMVEPFENWCFDESRKPGDYGLVKTEYGYHIMYFVNSTDLWAYYAEKDWYTEQVSNFMMELSKSYPMEVDYSQIVLGLASEPEAE